MNPDEFMNQIVPKEQSPEEIEAIKQTLGRVERVAVVDEQHNPYKNFANFINSARRVNIEGYVKGNASYPANHPLAIEMQTKAEKKRARKAKLKRMEKNPFAYLHEASK